MKVFWCAYDELAHALAFSPGRDAKALRGNWVVNALYDAALWRLRAKARTARARNPQGVFDVTDADVLRLAMDLACGDAR